MRSASDTRHTQRRDGCTVTARVMHSVARQRDDFGECGFNNTRIHTAAASEAAEAVAVEIAAAAGLGLADSRESEMGESKVRPAGESEGEERERRPHAPRLNLFLSRSHFHCVSPRSRALHGQLYDGCSRTHRIRLLCMLPHSEHFRFRAQGSIPRRE